MEKVRELATGLARVKVLASALSEFGSRPRIDLRGEFDRRLSAARSAARASRAAAGKSTWSDVVETARELKDAALSGVYEERFERLPECARVLRAAAAAGGRFTAFVSSSDMLSLADECDVAYSRHSGVREAA